MRYSSKYLIKSLLVVIFCTILSCDTNNNNATTIIRIIDGDTYEVIYNGKEEKIRLIGIDTPETRRGERLNKSADSLGIDNEVVLALGKKAKNFVSNYLRKGNKVKLEFDIQERDRWGRLLVYLYLDNGTFFNEYLVREGYATTATYPPNVKYQNKFLEAERYARENNKGLWAD